VGVAVDDSRVDGVREILDVSRTRSAPNSHRPDHYPGMQITFAKTVGLWGTPTSPVEDKVGLSSFKSTSRRDDEVPLSN